MRTIELGVTITDAAIDEESTAIFCTPVTRDARCPGCGCEGRYRDTVTRPLTDLPVAGYPLVLRVAVPRYRCTTIDCGRTVFNQTSWPSSTTTPPTDPPKPSTDDRKHCRNALGFRNFTHYRWRSLLHSGAVHTLVNAL